MCLAFVEYYHHCRTLEYEVENLKVHWMVQRKGGKCNSQHKTNHWKFWKRVECETLKWGIRFKGNSYEMM